MAKEKRNKIDFKTYVTTVKKIDLPYEVIQYIYANLKVKTIGEYLDNFVPIMNEVQEKFSKIDDQYIHEHLDDYISEVYLDIFDM